VAGRGILAGAGGREDRVEGLLQRRPTVRTTRAALAAISLAAVVLAGCARGEGPDPASPEPAVAELPAPSAERPSPNPGTRAPGAERPGAAEAVATAKAYLRREVGMTDVAAGPLRWTGDDTGEVTAHPRTGESGRPWPANGPVTTVSLKRLASVWYVLGVRASGITVAAPDPLDRVSSPVRVAGSAAAYEGTVQVTVTEDRYGKDVELGRGFVTGSGSAEPGPFSGSIAFRRPSGTTGSIIFWEEAAATGGGVVKASVVRVRFARTAAPAPRIIQVTTTPELDARDGWLRLPGGAGTLVVRVRAADATRVRLTLTPTGTGTAPYARLLDADATAGNGFTLTWRYQDQSLSGHLGIQASGPGGQVERSLNVYHD
jgi:Immunoglobulin-like domain of bacterial spore germination